jgi:hypothetical protein
MPTDNDTDGQPYPEYGLPRDKSKLPNGRPRPLTADENSIAIRRAMLRDEELLPRNVRPPQAG